MNFDILLELHFLFTDCHFHLVSALHFNIFQNLKSRCVFVSIMFPFSSKTETFRSFLSLSPLSRTLSPMTLRPGTLEPETMGLWDPDTQEPENRWNSETQNPESRTLITELVTQIPSILTHTTDWINFNCEANFDNKKLRHLSQKLDLGAEVDGPKHLPKYFDIWHNTKKLENT